MKKLPSRLGVFLLLTASSALSQPPAQPAQPVGTLGELLYTTHCIGCHTTRIHWRNNRQAFNWDSLKTQVRRWQGNAGLAWNEADIAAVSRYLNETIYRYPTPTVRVGLVSPPKSPSNQPPNRGQ